jgi:hypothetical protein
MIMTASVNPGDGLVLIKLWTAHVLSDFVLHPYRWKGDLLSRPYSMKASFLHALLAALVSYLMLLQWRGWLLPLVLFSGRVLIDFVKFRQASPIVFFLINQIAQVILIGATWYFLVSNREEVSIWVKQFLQDEKIWVLLFGFVFVIYPCQYIVKYATGKWSNPLISDSSDGEALVNAGKWIGIFERVIILVLVIYAKFEAIGFLIAAKSFIRFSETEKNSRSKTEYVLIGTLISFTLAMLTGVGMRRMLGV